MAEGVTKEDMVEMAAAVAALKPFLKSATYDPKNPDSHVTVGIPGTEQMKRVPVPEPQMDGSIKRVIEDRNPDLAKLVVNPDGSRAIVVEEFENKKDAGRHPRIAIGGSEAEVAKTIQVNVDANGKYTSDVIVSPPPTPDHGGQGPARGKPR